MRVKFEIYRKNPAATFWSVLGTILTYFSAMMLVCIIFSRISATDNFGIGIIVWVIGSIAVEVVFCVLVNAFCMSMINKTIKKKKKKILLKHR